MPVEQIEAVYHNPPKGEGAVTNETLKQYKGFYVKDKNGIQLNKNTITLCDNDTLETVEKYVTEKYPDGEGPLRINYFRGR